MPTITVSAKQPDGFRRCGIKFTREPRTVEVDAKTLAVLKAESNLVVEETKVKTPPPPPPPPGGQGGSDDDPSAKAVIAKIGECKTIDEVKSFFKNETRVTVIQAAKAKIAALKDAAKAAETK